MKMLSLALACVALALCVAPAEAGYPTHVAPTGTATFAQRGVAHNVFVSRNVVGTGYSSYSGATFAPSYSYGQTYAPTIFVQQQLADQGATYAPPAPVYQSQAPVYAPVQVLSQSYSYGQPSFVVVNGVRVFRQQSFSRHR